VPDFLEISIEVCLTLIAIGIPTFFLCRWYFKKFIKVKETRKIASWVGVILLMPIIYIICALITVEIIFHIPHEEFNRAKWFESKKSRWKMKNNLIESEILNGKNKAEVVNLLGKSDVGDTTNIWNYDLGVSGKGLGWCFNHLELTFENEKVIKVKKIEIDD
jgi:Na+(H+)/acetate symporter ActP